MTTTLLLIVVTTLPFTQGRPQAVRVASELSSPSDRRWDTNLETNEVSGLRDAEKFVEIARSFRQSKSLHRAMMEVLKGLREDELRLLERTLALEEELPQGDMPVAAEDLVDDSPQELPDEDGPVDDGLAEYRGELAVLDNVNATHEYPRDNFTDPEEPLYPQIQKMNREKLKEMRLATIKNQIMNILWPVGTPPSLRGNVTLPQPPARQDLLRVIAERMKTPRTAFIPEDVYTEKIQSFYPSCERPRNTDPELWSDSQTMNLWFDLTYPSTLQGTQVNIVAAKLRLFKLSQGNMTESYIPAESEDIPSEQVFSTSSSFSEDKMIRVSVYWYTRSLKKHRVKRKLLDSQMLSAYKESWTEWNIRGAVKAWRDNGRNFGLAVVVEDEDGNMLPTSKYFAPMNCSLEASTSRPIPGFLVARALSAESGFNSSNHTFGQALPLDTLLFPMIDLCTIEYPESEKPDLVYYHRVSEVSNSNRKSDTKTLEMRRAHNSTVASAASRYALSETEKHRIRHQSHKLTDDNQQNPPRRHLETVRTDDGDSIEEITWADDLDGHQLRKQIIVQKVIMKKQNSREEEDNDR